ncbi:MAG: amino acid-binding protein [Clostridiales bacterium]|nr:amino acid-binding protein [Clostridiales bacterium]
MIMLTKQLSVFIENRQGRLGEVLSVLKTNKVNILSLSLADTTEYGLLRLIVNNPELGKEKLSEDGFSTMLTDVIVLNINHEAGSLQGLLTLLSDNGINVEYMYGLSIDGDEAYVVLKTSDMAKANEVLVNNGVKTLSCGEIAKL